MKLPPSKQNTTEQTQPSVHFPKTRTLSSTVPTRPSIWETRMICHCTTHPSEPIPMTSTGPFFHLVQDPVRKHASSSVCLQILLPSGRTAQSPSAFHSGKIPQPVSIWSFLIARLAVPSGQGPQSSDAVLFPAGHVQDPQACPG